MSPAARDAQKHVMMSWSCDDEGAKASEGAKAGSKDKGDG